MPFRRFRSPGARVEQRLAVALLLAGLALVGVLVLQLLLPWLLLAGLAGGGIWFWQRRQAQEKALHLLFYDQLALHQGRISTLEFAMVAKITGAEARAFLDARAQEFLGDFEPTDAGDVLYTFRSLRSAAPVQSAPPVSPRPTPVAAGLQLSAAELAQRLGCGVAELAHQHQGQGFSQWTQSRDPDGCGWVADGQGHGYRPLL